ncbi:hypothetical protein C8J30_103162 [Rhodobacter viridis]|uniref:Uncharacterized protein n=2 Tax=Rhodobacter viridis TaxID=1054202 RepID=A0A318U091_9RHOB|nr:hypothetical protein C8J30_103162 [Rhodobacter viridis]
MQVVQTDIPAAQASAVAETLALCELAPTETEAGLLLIGSADPAQALAQIAAFAAQRPAPARAGADTIASGQVIWLMPEGTAARLKGALQEAARSHAPQLRVNAIHLGTLRPRPAPWQSAWGAAQPHPGSKPLPEALAEAIKFLLQVPSVTGQVVNVNPLV